MKNVLASQELEAVFARSIDAELNAAIASAPPFAPSPAFEERMDRLLAKEKRLSHRLVNAAWKRALIAAVLIIMLLAIVSCAVPAIRRTIAGFFIKDYSNHFEFISPDDLRGSIETEYGFDPVPEGYKLEIHYQSTQKVNTYYCNDEGYHLSLDQYGTPNLSMNIDNERSDFTESEINGIKIYCGIGKNNLGFDVYWVNDGYLFCFGSDAPFDEQWMVEVFLTIKPIE